jgi:pyruvate/2-oxoglutarate dehydrogenase complex dihydrolipoamide dehydrogenase (E3) component
MTFDLGVIGAGSGGLTLAVAAAQFGLKVVLFEKGRMGGDCLNTGCVPSKALLAAAKRAHALSHSAAFGIAAGPVVIDFAAVADHVQQVIATLAPHDSVARMEGLGITVVQAAARFVSPVAVEASGQRYTARRFAVATGSRPHLPPIPGLAEVPFLTTETIFDNRVLPRHLAIIGGGPIGVEMAQAHRRLGAEVTLIEAQEVLGRDDPDLRRVVVEHLQSEGIAVLAATTVQRVRKDGAGVGVETSQGPIAASHLLVAAGRSATVDNLGLEAAGIAYTARGITVNAALRSSNRRVYAIGDVAGGWQFTHVAGYQAGLVLRNLLFRLPVKNRTDVIPTVTYSDPELAQVGLTEAAARARYGEGFRVLRWHFRDNDRAQAERQTAGLVKVLVGPRGRILGAGIVGVQAGELIQPWVLALSRGLPISAMAQFVAPYPTLGDASRRAAVTYFAGWAKSAYMRRLVRFLTWF